MSRPLLQPSEWTIVAKESLPTVSVNRVSSSFIEEGEDAVFNVSASGTLSETLPVAVTVSQGSGNFINTTANTNSNFS